jgi:hypothetical protein
MHLLMRTAGIFVLAVALLAGSEWAARRFDPATLDERAVLDRFVPMVAEQDCVPGWTSTVGDTPRDRRWVEADQREAARIDAAARRATVRDSRLRTDRGWMLPILASVLGSMNCSHPVRIGTPTFSGEFAFVTAATDEGVSISAFRHRPDGWVWTSAAWDGDGVIQY